VRVFVHHSEKLALMTSDGRVLVFAIEPEANWGDHSDVYFGPRKQRVPWLAKGLNFAQMGDPQENGPT
jgi:hypothetical protein